MTDTNIITDADLYRQVLVFLKKTGMTRTMFGKLAGSDSGMLLDMADETRTMTLRRANRIQAFMRDYQATKAARKARPRG